VMLEPGDLLPSLTVIEDRRPPLSRHS